MSRQFASALAVALCSPALLAPSGTGCPDCDLAIVGVDSPKQDTVQVTVKNIGSAKSLGWLELFVDTATAPGPREKPIAGQPVDLLLPGEVVTLSFEVSAKWEAYFLLDEGPDCVGSCLNDNMAAVFDIRSDVPKYTIDSLVPFEHGCTTCW